MNTTVEMVREVLNDKYKAHTGRSLATFSQKNNGGVREPTWSWVDSTLSLNEKGTRYGGVAIDPDIGVCAFFLPYERSHTAMAHISHALRIRSALLPTEQNSIHTDVDINGSWRVALHWLLNPSELSQWLDQVAHIRSDTAHFEEVSIDAIAATNQNWRATLIAYEFPRLLLRTRELLDRKSQARVDDWASADLLVRKLIERFPDHFKDERARLHATEVRTQLGTAGTDSPRADINVSQPRTLTTLSIRKFRNIDSLSFDFSERTGASVIHGPNGTGKSSIFEALSFALCGSSFRFKFFVTIKTTARKTNCRNICPTTYRL
jgi:hypothetical protein